MVSSASDEIEMNHETDGNDFSNSMNFSLIFVLPDILITHGPAKAIR